MKKLLLYIALVLYCNVNAQQLVQLPSTQPLAQPPSTPPLVQLPFNNYHLTTETEQIELYNTYLNNTSSDYAANDKGSGAATVNGVTVTWEVYAPVFGIIWWIINYSDGTSEEYFGSFGNAKRYAQEQAYKKAQQLANSVPIGNGLYVLLIFTILYIFYIKIKTRKITTPNC